MSASSSMDMNMNMNMNSNNNSNLNMKYLYTDPRSIDKLLARELNSLSFDDREALSEQLHGVRSLAPIETIEMLNIAFREFQLEINQQITTVLSQSQLQLQLQTQFSQMPQSSVTSSSNNNSKRSSSSNNIKLQRRREYLIGILSTIPESLSSSKSSPRRQSSMMATTTTICLSTTSSSSSSSSNNNNNINNRINNNNINKTKTRTTKNSTCDYTYVRSFQFCIKFLRSELFDIKKSADRYIKWIDFLVDYFGGFALTRPLCITDLQKEEHKLLKEGQLQLLPSRDRWGRRVIVFLGAYGFGYTHMNRFKVCMYIIGQVASDDEFTQKNGLVGIYSHNSTNSSSSSLSDNNNNVLGGVDGGDGNGSGNIEYRKLRKVVEYISHQTECIRFMDAIPMRYSAFHCFLEDDLTRGMVLNMIGKKTRLITRIHTVCSITETEYLLRCFGIPTDNFPVTNTGSIKTKNLIKWIKQRTSLENQQRYWDSLSSSQNQNKQSSSRSSNNNNSNRSRNQMMNIGIECPDLNSVLIRNGGAAQHHPGNVKFRSILIRRERDRENLKTRPQKNQFLNSIIEESWANGLRFLLYVDKNDWYVEITDYNILRTKVFQAVRDQSVRRKRNEPTPPPGGEGGKAVNHLKVVVSHDSSTNLFTGLDNNNGSCTGCGFLNFKRQKRMEHHQK